MKPTRVTIADYSRIGIELGSPSDASRFLELGFQRSENYSDVVFFRSPDEQDVFRMCETLRDMGVPFSTHRTGGADYFIEVFRERGHVSGEFKRMNFFGNDFADDAPYTIETF